MAKARKFGTFGGVFTPSILTILGVIMYLRFPAIIGQAGLINTIGIVVIAHIISITSSLSVASLSTDKPVQTGGTYFMISRSLGLPIGGTLGLALFVGLSFSVSLYLIGFAESFLQYWGLDGGINSIRLTGSIVLIAVTTITFISTSLAIKSQYFIMAAIGLSLLSILFGQHDFSPEQINFTPLETAAPFMVLFGIFFPAVTGFEAGVSMSGDLQNPKKSLPIGAMLAVGVGFVVYIGLAFFYSYTVDAEVLANDPQILFKISLVPVLVIIGIWGATLSSALGSILGAPRILQAIAMDKIAPKFLAKGTGKTNEPRNALLLVFVIAEAGILIGELDVIARIVSMFFITTYAFLNMASAIESWSSSDFRPAFKVPRFVSVLGALSAFIVMILLDFLALAGATVVLGLLYFYLRRKELILETGDAWSSFWTNLAKNALLKLSKSKAEKRNWRPNIVLFSGGEKARPHLLEMGLALTGKLGALTDFNLSYGNQKKAIAEDADQLSNHVNNQGYFKRSLACQSLHEGIQTVTNVYGFSGFEPNTVLMGWSKNDENADFLSDMLKDLQVKKLNAVFLDYNKENGFKQKDSIDIWWNGKGRHLSFSLNILRFLLSDASWRDAHVRIMIINSDTSYHDNLYRNTNAVLQEKRIEAEVKVISDDFGSRTLEEIIKSESNNTDLIILGLSQKSIAHRPDYNIQRVNTICEMPVSTLLLSPSDEFEEINLIERQVSKPSQLTSVISVQPAQLPEIEIDVVKNKVLQLDEDLMKIGHEFCNQTVTKATQQIKTISSNLNESAGHTLATLTKELEESDKHEYQKTINRNQIAFLRNTLKIFQNDNAVIIKETEAALQNGISDVLNQLESYFEQSSETIVVPYQLPAKKKEKMLQFPYRKALRYYYQRKTKVIFGQQLALFEEASKNMLMDLRNLILEANDKLEKLFRDSQKTGTTSNDELAIIIKRFEVLNEQFEKTASSFIQVFIGSLRRMSIDLSENLRTPENLKLAKKRIDKKKFKPNDKVQVYAENWGAGMLLLNNAVCLDVMVLSKKVLFGNIIKKGNSRVSSVLTEALFTGQKALIENLKTVIQDPQSNISPVAFPDSLTMKIPINEAIEKASSLVEDLPEELSLPESIYKESEFLPFSEYNPVTVDVIKSTNYFVDVLLNEPLYREFENLEALVKKAIIESKEANSMLLFHKGNQQMINSEQGKLESDVSLFKKLLKQIEEEKIKVETAVERIDHYTGSYINEAFSKLYYHSIIESCKKLESGERVIKSKRLSLSLANLSDTIKHQLNNGLVYILNSASSSIIFSRKYLEEHQSRVAEKKEILDLVDKLLPDPRIYKSVPIFYRNLMSSSSKITDEFWVPRDQEMKAIKEALARHKRGYGGAVFITGVHGAGKTTLSRYAINHLFTSKNTYWIQPPVEGSTDPDVLFKEFKIQTGNSGNFNDIFNNIPYESVIVMNDFELWWERRPGGGQAIQQMMSLIKLYSQKVFIILNCNTYAYKALQQIYNINEFSLATIACSPFNARELQNMIIRRHKSSGITLTYKHREEDNIPQLIYSFIFNRYFVISGGTPGVALNLWKANITNIKNDMIEIKKPEKIPLGVLSDLPKEWILILALFLQHKNIDVHKLSRLISTSVAEAEVLLLSLENAGLIVRKSDRVYTFGRNIEPLIDEVCTDKGLI